MTAEQSGVEIIENGTVLADTGGTSFSYRDDLLPYAYGEPPNAGLIKGHPDEFLVDEILGFPLTDEGEHHFLRIEKVGENTEHVARVLARFAGVPALAVGYAGLKDRQARTRQWFSVGLAGRDTPDWSAVNTSTIRVIETGRHRRKLKRGDLLGNRFRITVRSVTGSREALNERLSRIAREGVPNYFGPQRFGHNGGNLSSALALLLGQVPVRSRHHRGLYLSAARSYLFNRILGQRIAHGSWNRPLTGDAFITDADDRPTKRLPEGADLMELMESLVIHPAGTLWGKGAAGSSGDALALEQAALQDCDELCEALEKVGMERAMRPLRVTVAELAWQFSDASTLQLQFRLPPGAYATSVLREVIRAEFGAVRDSSHL